MYRFVLLARKLQQGWELLRVGAERMADQLELPGGVLFRKQASSHTLSFTLQPFSTLPSAWFESS